jgi:predicted molibdopterin-dependent oxidoreductase YjgC
MVVDTVRPGEVFVPFHYGRGDQSANQHTWYARDPVSHQPQFKSSPVSVRRLSFGEPEPWLLHRLSELDGSSREPYASREFGGTVNRPVLQIRAPSIASADEAPAPVEAGNSP